METKAWKLWKGSDLKKWEVGRLEWHVDLLIPKGTVGFLSGQPKVGKSLLALDLSLVVGNAYFETTNWLGKFACSPANTLYVAREDPARRIKERAMEIQEASGRHKIAPGSLWFLIRDRFNLMEEEHVLWLEDRIRELEIDFLILDVFARMIPGLDENSAKDMAKVIDVIERINREHNLTILILDHTRKPPPGGSLFQPPRPFDNRGSSAKYGAADFFICVGRTSQDGRLRVYSENKDADEMEFFLDVSPKGDTSREKFTWGGEAASGDRKTVGEKNRKNVLKAVKEAGDDGITNKEVRKKTSLGKSAVTDHLAGLVAAGAVRREGTNINSRYYIMTDPPATSQASGQSG